MNIAQLAETFDNLHIETEGEQLARLMNRCLNHTAHARKTKKKAYNNSRRHCTICKKSVRRGGWSDHLTTNAHKRLVRKQKARAKKNRQVNPTKRLFKKPGRPKPSKKRTRPSRPGLSAAPKPRSPVVVGRRSKRQMFV